MENVKNVSSEEELLQLRNEGKISESEYEGLLQSLRKTNKLEIGLGTEDNTQPTRTSGLAIASLVFALLEPFGSIPAIICGHLALRKIEKQSILKGRGLALAGLIIGYAALGSFVALAILLLTPLLAYRGSEAIRTAAEVTEIMQFPLDNMEGLITQSGLQVDKDISSDGNGSLRIEATEPITVRLLETGGINLENARLIYQARLRTENLDGVAYLEMWCHFHDRGEFFSRGLMIPMGRKPNGTINWTIGTMTGTKDWTIQETPFLLGKGQKPDNVKLNLVIDGKGTVWIDDIRLLKGPLE